MWLRKVTGLLWIGGLVLFSAASWSQEKLSVDQAVARVLQDNPRLRELSSRVGAALAGPAQASALADPEVSLNLQNLPTDSFDRDQEAMTQLQLAVSQKLPWPGKRQSRADAAHAGIDQRRAQLEEARLKLAADVTKAWWQLHFLDKALEAVRDNQTQLRQWVRIAQSRYRVGDGQQQDVLQTQVELSNLLANEVVLTGKRRAAQARLNSLMDRSSNAPIELAEVVEPMPPAQPSLEALLNHALVNRPQLALWRSAVDQARHRLRLAEKDRYPDFTLRAAYGLRDGNNPDGSSRSDLFSVGVSVNVPIFAASKQDKAVEQRLHELEAQRYALHDNRRQIEEQLERALADLMQAREQAALFADGIIPQSQQTLESMRVGYRVNKVAFANLIRTQIQLNNYRTAYWQAISEARQAEAEVHAALGKEL